MAAMADSIGQALNNPLLYAGLGLMSAGAQRVGPRANVGAELMNALQMYQQQQMQQQQMAARQTEQQQRAEALEFEKQGRAAQMEQQQQKAEREAVTRQIIQGVLAKNPNAADRKSTRLN